PHERRAAHDVEHRSGDARSSYGCWFALGHGVQSYRERWFQVKKIRYGTWAWSTVAAPPPGAGGPRASCRPPPCPAPSNPHDRLGVVAQCQAEHRLAGFLSLCGNPHARLRSRSRATSLAKYVMMMSAPARLMPVSASIMAASSSSQPSWPAARIIAYSPDTE